MDDLEVRSMTKWRKHADGSKRGRDGTHKDIIIIQIEKEI